MPIWKLIDDVCHLAKFIDDKQVGDLPGGVRSPEFEHLIGEVRSSVDCQDRRKNGADRRMAAEPTRRKAKFPAYR